MESKFLFAKNIDFLGYIFGGRLMTGQITYSSVAVLLKSYFAPYKNHLFVGYYLESIYSVPKNYKKMPNKE